VTPRYLADTHIVARWFGAPQKLSREQRRVLREAERHGEPVAFSAITLLEIAVLVEHGIARIKITIEDLLNKISSDPLFEILPFTVEIAAEVAAVGPSLRDPGDRAIVATARVHRFILLTSDQRIIESKLVPTVS